MRARTGAEHTKAKGNICSGNLLFGRARGQCPASQSLSLRLLTCRISTCVLCASRGTADGWVFELLGALEDAEEAVEQRLLTRSCLMPSYLGVSSWDALAARLGITLLVAQAQLACLARRIAACFAVLPSCRPASPSVARNHRQDMVANRGLESFYDKGPFATA